MRHKTSAASSDARPPNVGFLIYVWINVGFPIYVWIIVLSAGASCGFILGRLAAWVSFARSGVWFVLCEGISEGVARFGVSDRSSQQATVSSVSHASAQSGFPERMRDP